MDGPRRRPFSCTRISNLDQSPCTINIYESLGDFTSSEYAADVLFEPLADEGERHGMDPRHGEHKDEDERQIPLQRAVDAPHLAA